MMSNKYIAIDVGSSKISALAAEVQPDNTLKILADEFKASDDVKNGIVEQVSGAAYKISELYKLIKNSSKSHDVDQVSVSIGAKSMKSLNMSISRFVGASKTVSESLIFEMTEECTRKVQRENVAVYDVIPVYYELDGHRTDEPVNKKAVQIIGNYTVIYGSKTISESLDRCFERTGIITECTPVAIESISAAVLDEEERENGCALINFGASTTTLAIYRNDVLKQMLVVPLGGKNITHDIQELGISEMHAERLKCLKGCALESMVEEPVLVQIPAVGGELPPVKISTQFLATIIEARLEEILKPVFNAIQNFPEPLDGGIIITGGASKLNHLTEFIYEKSDLNARTGNHTDWLTDKTPAKYHDTIYSQLVGTIILNHEYRQSHPVEETKVQKPVKLPTKNIKDRITTGLINFFGDENSMS